jgi:hypothetical protein
MECLNERNIDVYGWTVWGLLVFTSRLEDFANGFKLIYISVSRASLHCFFGSAILLAVSAMAAYTSFVYNRAIAVSSTELIVNAVILLFVNEIDELMFNAVRVIFPSWVDDIVHQADVHSSVLLGNVENDDGVSKGDKIPAAGCNSFDSSPNMDGPMTMENDVWAGRINIENDDGVSKGDEIPAAGCNSFDFSLTMDGPMTMENNVWAGRIIDDNRVHIIADKDSGNADSSRITQSDINSKLAKLERELLELKEMQRGLVEEEQDTSGNGFR